MRLKLLLFTILVMIPLKAYSESVYSSVKKGNQLYTEEKYNEALTKYSAAELEAPANGIVGFNKGNALYKLNKYEKSNEALTQSIPKMENPKSKALAYYNMGNNFFRLEQYDKAIESYKKSLELNPEDEDAKFNLELTRKKIKDQSKPENQNQQNQQSRSEHKESSLNWFWHSVNSLGLVVLAHRFRGDPVPINR